MFIIGGVIVLLLSTVHYRSKVVEQLHVYSCIKVKVVSCFNVTSWPRQACLFVLINLTSVSFVYLQLRVFSSLLTLADFDAVSH